MRRTDKGKRPARSSEFHRRVSVRREKGLPPAPANASIRQAVRQTLSHLRIRGDCSLSVLLARDESVLALNTRFRGVPRTTDVLAFPAHVADPDGGCVHLGNIILSLPRAEVQARARNHTLEQEALLLVVHGTLHLAGFDHDTPARRKRMWAAQREILNGLQSGPAVTRRRRGGTGSAEAKPQGG